VSFHSFFEYLKYRRKAMGRHGMHSPFVYALVEDCIEQNRQIPLIDRIKNFLKDWPVTDLSGVSSDVWIDTIKTLETDDIPRRMIIVKDIHATPADSANWIQVSNSTSIQYSIDLFDFGLLFINPDFKEKQHFVLKK